jgi:hypothetical protein
VITTESVTRAADGERAATPMGQTPLTAWVAMAAILSAVAGAVHFAVLTDHAEEWLTEGVLFGVVGALQLGIAMALIARPGTRLLWIATLVNALPPLAWGWVIVNGRPIGPGSGVAETADLVGWFTATVEVLAVVGAARAAVTAQRSPAPRRSGHVRRQLAVASATVVGLMITGGTLAKPLAAHTHGDAERSHHEDASTSTDHDHASVADEPMTAADRAELGAALEMARTVALSYPTVSDAELAGYVKAGPISEGNGAHYINSSFAFETQFDVHKPLAIMYAGNESTSPVIGLMYYTRTMAPPAGFVGPNDHWHQHSGACYRITGEGLIDVPLPVDADVTKKMCDAVDGDFMARSGWMLHVWVVPGWESPQGVFSHHNPAILCPMGTSETGNLATGCQPT